ncbi:MAG: hypothetical protein JWP66_1331 [Naasia sp.]|nr:hypothetical protein [Naasia sp.]
MSEPVPSSQEAPSQEAPPAARRATRRSATGREPRRRELAVAAAFALPFCWDLVEAVANLLALLAFAEGAGHSLNSYAWLVLGSAILVPPASYAAGVALGFAGGPLRLAAILLAALAACSCLGLTLEALLRA